MSPLTTPWRARRSFLGSGQAAEDSGGRARHCADRDDVRFTSPDPMETPHGTLALWRLVGM